MKLKINIQTAGLHYLLLRKLLVFTAGSHLAHRTVPQLVTEEAAPR